MSTKDLLKLETEIFLKLLINISKRQKSQAKVQSLEIYDSLLNMNYIILLLH